MNESKTNFDASTIQEITKLARVGIGPQMVTGGNVPMVLVPDGYTAKAMPELIYNDNEKHEVQPKRITTTVSVLDADSFVRYFTEFKSGDSRVFAYEPESKVTGIMDYHTAEGAKPHWCQHRLVLSLRHSEPWKAWTNANNKHLSQAQFAEFLEQFSMDIVDPSPASILEVARDMQASTEAEFSGGARANGQVSFKYSEQTKGTVGVGKLGVPERFVISIPCYVGGDTVPMEALLRFRLKEGHLELWFTLVRPEEVARQAFIGARDHIEKALDLQIVNGQMA